MADGQGSGDGRVVSLADRQSPGTAPASTAVPARGEPVAFGVELPARGDLVFSVAALTQLITLADHAGLNAAGELGRAITSLRRRLRAHGIGLPPALEEMVEQLTEPRLNRNTACVDVLQLPVDGG